ncbi:hypothetical protein B0H67DRAFT_545113 [Lasiosphaeris hirsuta]|uniref:Transport protein USO1 n=1 Tax=Lasiosphaeris hirsuta TaxID=260670 RepID=A0AA39ZW27_9PEZI|nr:hypothetical protein B0H67DRAFT_545113 [Lasiosphaeris hirsuta]
MPPIERDAPRDMDRALRHQHSASSDHGRALIPMWDSSDPERAPPPLPLNPQSPSVVSRAGTSSAIQSAHAALTEKARESAMVPHYPKRKGETSPERLLLRGSTHRRMQSLQPSSISLQPASVKDLSLMIESGRESPTLRSPEKTDRPSTPSRGRDPFVEARSERDDRTTMGSPIPGPSLTPIIRPTVRRPHQSILGENTPPQSATMIALQTMNTHGPAPPPSSKEPENPLANITNGQTALVRLPQSLDSLSNQILTLTNIATTLQKEMSQLSRRSRDNATDLLSLKEATNARDEDIRKSLRELITDTKVKPNSRDPYGGPLLLEGRHHPTSPTTLAKTVRPFALPRIPSPNSFAASLDRESSMSTPSLYGPDSPATIALLEKIIREMSTREGQDSLLTRLTELADRLAGLAGADKVEELVRLIRSNQQQAVIPASGGKGGGGGGGGRPRERAWSISDDGEGPLRRDFDFNQTSALSTTEFINEDVLKAIRTVKDSVAQGGGLTAEVKALVRELRGEVLGMGREIGRRLDEVASRNATSGKSDPTNKAEMTKVIEEGLAEMKQQMDNVLREHRRQSSATTVSRDTTIDYKEIYNSMRAALKDSQANKPRVPDLRREDVMQAVKDAWEKYKPEIEIQQIGLERDEILECLKEGLRAYAPRDERPPGATRDEVFKAVVEGLKHFVPPQVDTPVSLSRDEILEAVRECLEEFEFPVAPSPPGQELSKDDMLDAVKEGLHSFDFPSPPPLPPPGPDLTRDDVLDAVNEGLHTFDFSAVHSSALVAQPLTKGDVSDVVKQSLKSLDFTPDMLDAVTEGVRSLDLPTDMLQAVRDALASFDFASVYSSALIPRSDLTRVDVADAIKEGLDSLNVSENVRHAVNETLKSFDFAAIYSSAIMPRSDLSRVDVADAVKEGFDTANIPRGVEHAVKKGLESFDFSVVQSSALVQRSDLSRVDVADAVKEGLESLDLPSGVARAVKEGLDSFEFPSSNQSSALVPLTSTNDEIIQSLQEIKSYIQNQFQCASEEAKQNMAANGRDTEQVLDATKDGFEKLRQDIEIYVDRARGDSDPEETMAHLVRTFESFRDEVAELIARTTDESKEMLREEIESLRDAVNSSLVPALPQPGTSKEFVEALQDGLGSLRTDISTRPLAGLTEILDALQEGLGDIRCSIDRLQNKPTDLTANDEILDALKVGLDSVRNDIGELKDENRNDRALATIDDTEEKAVVPVEEPLKHDDIKNLEGLITQLGVKVEALESAPPPVIESISKEDLAEIQEKLNNVAGGVEEISSREPLEALEALNALEERVKLVQDMITELSTREPPAAPEPSNADAATREDVEAIETILRNTKARLDDFIDGDQAVNKDHIDILETHILETREVLSKLASGLDTVSSTVSSKDDINNVESLVTQIISSFDEMKERHEKTLEDPERVTKTDIDAVEALCLDIKTVIEQMLKSDLTTLATREDVMNVESLLKEYKERIDSQTESSSTALEVRQAEMVSVGDRVIEVKTFLEEFQGVVRSKLEDGAKGIDAINAVLDTMSDTVRKNANISDDLKDMFDTMKMEFEESRAGVVGAKLEADDKFLMTTETLTTKLDERMAELFIKYDEFQLLQDERAAKGEERDIEMEATVVGTKAIAEELKLLIDTLGTAVTDSLEKMEEASKTVFDRVEELVNKSDGNHEDGKAEHQLTREQVQEVIGKVDGLQGVLVESEPKILEAIQDVLLLVGQHYEHAKSSTMAIQEKIEEAKPPELPMLPPPEKYDDSIVLEKLDRLVDHTTTADKAFEQLNALDSVHAQVKHIAAELAAFVAAQTQRITDEHEDREKSLQETIVALERRLEEKQHVEESLSSLREEEARLKESITVTLRAEQEQMKEQFLANLVEEESRLKDINASLREEQDQLKETFLASLKEEQARLMEINVAIKEEQDQLKETFTAGLKEEQARLMETNLTIKEEHDRLKEAFMANLKEEQARLQSRLKEVNESLRAEHQLLKDTLLSNLREEESLLKESNATLRAEQEQFRESFIANLKDEELRLKEANENLRQEQEQLKTALKEDHERLKATLNEEYEQLKAARNDEHEQLKAALKDEHEQLKATLKDDHDQLKTALKEEHERLKVELLANLMEEEIRLKEVNTSLREEQERIKAEFLATFKEEELRLREMLFALRDEEKILTAQNARLSSELHSTETALTIRREDNKMMESQAESLERRILEGVMDHSRVLLLAKQNRVVEEEPMSRKRVPSRSAVETEAKANGNSKPRSAFNMALSAKNKLGTPTPDRRILSLSQITNNVPVGGLKRSQSVRTATGGGRLRKTSWAGRSQPKGYGDLDKDKENHELKESDEDNEHQFNVDGTFDNPSPVDIVINEANSVADYHPDDEPLIDEHIDDEPAGDHIGEHVNDVIEEFENLDFAGDGELEVNDGEDLRRSSRGTTVITTTEGGYDDYTDEEDHDSHDDHDDAASDWTDTATGAETALGVDSVVGSVE